MDRENPDPLQWKSNCWRIEEEIIAPWETENTDWAHSHVPKPRTSLRGTLWKKAAGWGVAAVCLKQPQCGSSV